MTHSNESDTDSRLRALEQEVAFLRGQQSVFLAYIGATVRPRKARKAPAPSPTDDVGRIIDIVAGRYGVSRSDVLSPDRRQQAVLARQVAMRLIREATGKSYPEIGRIFDRDHTTVMHALEVTEGFALGDLREELAGVE